MRMKHTCGAVVALSLVLAACGSDANTETADQTSDQTTVQSTDETTVQTSDQASDGSAPSAIISLSPTATEMLYAIGAGDQVMAVDDFSNHPDEAAVKMQGLSGYEPNVEAIAGLEPDLVITDGTQPVLLEQLDSLGIAHYEGVAATGFADVYAQIEQLGELTGHVAESTELVDRMQADVEVVKSKLPALPEPLTYYHELDPTLFSVSSDTFIGSVYAELGLVNIVDLSVDDLGAYPQLSAEFIVDADPDLIFLACTKYCGDTADTLAARPGWEDLTAVRTGGVIEMDDDIASRWGPRMVDYLALAGEGVARVVEQRPAG